MPLCIIEGSKRVVGVTKALFVDFYFKDIWYLILQKCFLYSLSVTFLFGSCRHSQAAATPVKYECDIH